MKPRQRPVERLRLGAVAYLNSRPITYGLERGLGANRFLLEYDVPSRCAARLAAGEIDLGLIPSIEFVRQKGCTAVPGICIAADGPAASVLLFSHGPVEEARTIAVDVSSRASAALLRILSRERWRTDPVLREEPPDLEAMLARADAALLIGDRALIAGTRPPAGTVVTDLAAEWKALTGLPFVFALWAGPDGIAGPDEVALLQESLARGLSRLDEIARSHTPKGPLGYEEVHAYLRENIVYRFGQRERDGLLRFWLLAGRHGLIDDVPEMRFFGEPAGSGVPR